MSLVPNRDLKSACQDFLEEMRQFEASSDDVATS